MTEHPENAGSPASPRKPENAAYAQGAANAQAGGGPQTRGGPGAGWEVALREVRDADLPFFHGLEADTEAVRMAAFGDPGRDRASSEAHWARIRNDPAVVVRTVVLRPARGPTGSPSDGREEAIGHAAVYGPPGEREVTYWLAREHWGRGHATAALRALLAAVPERPLHAHVAEDNTGRCGCC
jgi:RimJ/RimL family protein N-acetyltransferase